MIVLSGASDLLSNITKITDLAQKAPEYIAAVASVADKIPKYIPTVISVLQDPALDQVIALVQKVADNTKRIDCEKRGGLMISGSCKGATATAPTTTTSTSKIVGTGTGVGLSKAITPLKSYLWYQDNPWVTYAVIAAAIVVPIGVGVVIGRATKRKAATP